MERDNEDLSNIVDIGNFNSHAHVERDRATNGNKTVNKISTHTLTWSVTHYFLIISSYICISTHTLTWSVTINAQSKHAISIFQLTRSRGA